MLLGRAVPVDVKAVKLWPLILRIAFLVVVWGSALRGFCRSRKSDKPGRELQGKVEDPEAIREEDYRSNILTALNWRESAAMGEMCCVDDALILGGCRRTRLSAVFLVWFDRNKSLVLMFERLLCLGLAFLECAFCKYIDLFGCYLYSLASFALSQSLRCV